MSKALGEKQWIIPDGYIPEVSSGDLVSHESICVLNCSSEEAKLSITIYFEDREPISNIQYTVPGRRTKHIRTSSLHRDEEYLPVGVPYAIQVESNIPVVVQYSRLDSTQSENALMSTMAYPITM
ncbi:sensory rhodopsin transducer [Paenibacillus septentrionalis]|uniref:Sensory rhodopsin transducer n=1 Tax=Paenibacillus septentrionalis TaxID=429342 RepID=A0ABW1V862_9BACL